MSLILPSSAGLPPSPIQDLYHFTVILFHKHSLRNIKGRETNTKNRAHHSPCLLNAGLGCTFLCSVAAAPALRSTFRKNTIRVPADPSQGYSSFEAGTIQIVQFLFYRNRQETAAVNNQDHQCSETSPSTLKECDLKECETQRTQVRKPSKCLLPLGSPFLQFIK